MDNTLVSLIILSSLLFIGLVIVLILLLKKKCNDKITTFTVPFSTTANSGLLTNVNAKCYLVENDDISYLVLPGEQNSFSYKNTPGVNNPTNLTSDFSQQLSNYEIYNPSGMFLGYFNNCGYNDVTQWILVNGVLSVKPIRGVNQQPINVNNCLSPGQTLTLGFGPTVIPLKKNN